MYKSHRNPLGHLSPAAIIEKQKSGDGWEEILTALGFNGASACDVPRVAVALLYLPLQERSRIAKETPLELIALMGAAFEENALMLDALDLFPGAASLLAAANDTYGSSYLPDLADGLIKIH